MCEVVKSNKRQKAHVFRKMSEAEHASGRRLPETSKAPKSVISIVKNPKLDFKTVQVVSYSTYFRFFN